MIKIVFNFKCIYMYASHGSEEESCPKKETDQPKYSTVFESMSCNLKRVEVSRR